MITIIAPSGKARDCKAREMWKAEGGRRNDWAKVTCDEMEGEMTNDE